MKIAIIGTGGVGGYFGAKLQKAGYEVNFLARGEHLKAIQHKGLLVKSILGDFSVKNVKVTENIQDIGMADLIIVAVKAWQIKQIASELKAITGKETVILPLQNGVMAARELSDCIPQKHILGGLCRIISKIETPGVINHFAIDPVIVFGEFNKFRSSRAIRIKEVFENAGIASKIADDINAEIWKKFIAICVSALLGITRSTYGEVRKMKETRQLMYDLQQEIYHLSEKEGVNIDPDFVNKSMAFIDTFPPESTSSLTRDIWEGKPSELEYQNGTVVKLAEKHQLEVPVNKFIYYCLLPSEQRAREKLNSI